jgi:SHS2 domain-containing protein
MNGCGIQEIAHTADWAVRIWAPDLQKLFITAAQGMYNLMEIRNLVSERHKFSADLSTQDAESLLVAFLSELLYQCDQNNLCFDQFDLVITSTHLHSDLGGFTVLNQNNKIKAVTFSNLAIKRTDRGLETVIVFDV